MLSISLNNVDDCLTNWVEGVSATGDFYGGVNQQEYRIIRGVDAVPDDWNYYD